MSAYDKEGHQRQTRRERFLSSCPEVVQVSLSEIVAGVQEGLLSLCTATWFAVLRRLMEAEVTEICGPKGKHDRKGLPRSSQIFGTAIFMIFRLLGRPWIMSGIDFSAWPPPG
ncbi:MAG: hypothetical protein M1299_01155 [Firmicutes bacterium]|nr:hypothetical protein [Bacillota bacterium]MCL5038432.1 hypothetical protein [Bacillota bacterium]